MSELYRTSAPHTEPKQEPAPRTEKPLWLSYRAAQILAVVIGVLPLYGFVIWAHLSREGPYSLQDMFLYPLVVGTLGVIWLIFLHTTLCGERLSSFNLRSASLLSDLAAAISLTLLTFGWMVVESVTIRQWLPREPPAPEILDLIRGVAGNPWLLVLWLGPVVWIGVALFEELSRVFLLTRLWSLSSRPAAQWAALLFSALLFGAAHLYQGIAGAVSVGVIGLIWGLAYFLWGRVWPLIIAHALFDSIQVGWVVIQIRAGQ
jgi:membrane protease YdiL (CAAX protease family)